MHCKSGIQEHHEFLFARISQSRRPAHTTTLKTYWRTTNLDQNVEASASSSQLASTAKPVTSKNRTVLDRQKERQVKHEEEEEEENDQASTEKPVTLKKRTLLDQQNEQESQVWRRRKWSSRYGETQYHKKWNFRFSNSGFAAFKSWTSRRRESSSTGGQNWDPSSQRRSSSWPTTRQYLQSFQQKFEEDDSHELGNVEYFELCETDSRVPCSYCLFYWTQGFLYCTCGLCLNNMEEVRKLNQGRFDALPISNWIIRKKSVHESSSWKVRRADLLLPVI